MPPRESIADKVWKLMKAVYDLADANRTWYLKIQEEFIKVGVIISKTYQSIFTRKENANIKGYCSLFCR